MDQPRPTPDLHLVPLAGPELRLAPFKPGPAVLLGRASEAGVCLLHESVSRRHCSIQARGDGWFVVDLGSTHGTHFNGVKLAPDLPAPLHSGDLLRVGPWTFRVVVGALGPGAVGGRGSRSGSAVRTIDDLGERTLRLERVSVDSAGLSGRRLKHLIDCIASLEGLADEHALAKAALDAALAGCGFGRGAVLARTGDSAQVVVLAQQPTQAMLGGEAFAFSRSLLAAADDGRPVILGSSDGPGSAGGAGLSGAVSIAELNIRSAICAPVMLEGAVAGYIYLDARGAGVATQHPGEAAAYCEAVARAYALATSSRKRAELEARQRELSAQLGAAHEAQRFILPAETARVGSIDYAMRMQPGVYVAGDLFDVVDLGSGRAAVFLGDVSGHGAGPGMLMATAQSHLHAVLRRGAGPVEAVDSANRYLAERAPAGMFISLWLGVFEPDGTLRYVDAGHGHWLHVPAGGGPRKVASPTGIPLGIDAQRAYEQAELALRPGDRVLLYSDGAVEERNPQGEFLGLDRLVRAIAGAADHAGDVAAAFEAIRAFAGTVSLDDDVTIASVAYRGDQPGGN
jgi:serine phosphatase RsbU (regulator of sigma subunit)